MLIKCFGVLEEYPEVTLEADITTLREILSYLDFTYGAEFVTTLINNPFYFILNPESENPIVLTEAMVNIEYTKDSVLYILPEVSGNLPVAAVVAGFAAAGVTVGATAAIVITAVINIAISIGLNMLMSALSPTPEFTSDPAYSQNKSNLFNGAPILKEQGGSVPLIFGNPWCGGVLISSGVFSEEI